VEFALSTEELDIQAMANRFMAEHEASALWSEEQPGAFDPAVYAEMAQLGFFTLTAPDAVGGMGMSHLAEGLVLEAAGYHLFPGPLLDHYAASALATRFCAEAPSVADLVAGTTFASPIYGWRGHGLPARVTGDGDGSLAGQALAGSGEVAGCFVVTAGTADESLVTVALVDPAATGITTGPWRHVDLSWSAALVTLAGCRPEVATTVPAAAAFRGLTTAAGLAAAYQLGCAQRMLDDTVEYAKDRQQFGKPIGSFQALKHRMADMYTEIEHSRSLVFAALEFDPGGEGGQLCLMAKAAADETLATTTEGALQIHAGIGFTWESHIHHYVRAAMRFCEWPWPTSTLRRLIRQALVGDDPDGLNQHIETEAA
jgi:alkylation response protein AidB-like acyl-CoA dehydrogenase